MNSNLDLIPVSSTVIPLHELTVSSHGNGTDEHIPKMLSRSEIKKLLKKHQISEKNPHELITGKFTRSGGGYIQLILIPIRHHHMSG
uniref:CSON008526 protein n=1 Tax=Culicoides sonorensis TaxID=179676 RepID=A0A336N192_CULSO